MIIEGRAKVIQGGKTKRTLGPGAHFGEMSLLDRSPRSATIEAETQVRALALSPTSFAGILADNWTVTRKILAELSTRVRALDKQVL